MPQRTIGLDTLLLAVIIIHLSKAKHIQCELQAIIVVEELNATSNGKHNIGVVLDGQGMNSARILAYPVAWASHPVVPTSKGISETAMCHNVDHHTYSL
jgi:hypothetical protein